MSALDFLKGLVSEYSEPLRDAVVGELNDALEKADRKLRDPKALRALVRGVAGGVASSWRACPHGEPVEKCEQCSTEKKLP